MPESYDLFIDPDLERGVFKGSETVTLNAVQTVDRIYLNAHGLTIRKRGVVSLRRRPKVRQTGCWCDSSKNGQGPAFLLSNPIEAGQYRLNIKFSGRMNDKLCGFYKVKASEIARDELLP